MNSTKTFFRKLVPPAVLAWFRRLKAARLRRQNRGQTVKGVFTHIYQRNVWGGQPNEFFSGQGSTAPHATVYAETVRQFIAGRHLSSVVDLGCGDFVVGQSLQMDGVAYIGVDIVDDLIARNQRQFGGPNTSFVCRDIIADELPAADLCLIRQVLQHLSNAQIATILQKTQQYPLVLITEHYPAPGRTIVPNKDKPAGGDIRAIYNSAVYLDQPPFRLQPVSLLLEVEVDPVGLPGETLRTFLVENAHAGSVTPRA